MLVCWQTVRNINLAHARDDRTAMAETATARARPCRNNAGAQLAQLLKHENLSAKVGLEHCIVSNEAWCAWHLCTCHAYMQRPKIAACVCPQDMDWETEQQAAAGRHADGHDGQAGGSGNPAVLQQGAVNPSHAAAMRAGQAGAGVDQTLDRMTGCPKCRFSKVRPSSISGAGRM